MLRDTINPTAGDEWLDEAGEVVTVEYLHRSAADGGLEIAIRREDGTVHYVTRDCLIELIGGA